MRADANAGAVARLTPEARSVIEDRCREVLVHFGYCNRDATSGWSAANERESAPLSLNQWRH
jgi:hypothetical protein